MKHPKDLLCYDLMEGITYEKKEILFVIKPNLFTLGTITLPELQILIVAIFGATIEIEDLMFNFPHLKKQIPIDITLACIRVQELDIT
jgi:hypothetical protein